MMLSQQAQQEMGIQSNWRRNQTQRKYQLAANHQGNRKAREEGTQLDVRNTGCRAFNSAIDCRQCIERALWKAGLRSEPKEKHDDQCTVNRNHKHKRQKTAQKKEDARIAAANKWQGPAERPGTTLAEKAALFVPRKSKPKPPPKAKATAAAANTTAANNTMEGTDGDEDTSLDFCKLVCDKLQDDTSLQNKSIKESKAPWPMKAFAKVVEETVLKKKH